MRHFWGALAAVAAIFIAIAVTASVTRIQTQDILDRSVTTIKMALGSVDSTIIANNSVSNVDLAIGTPSNTWTQKTNAAAGTTGNKLFALDSSGNAINVAAGAPGGALGI